MSSLEVRIHTGSTVNILKQEVDLQLDLVDDLLQKNLNEEFPEEMSL